MGKYDLSMRNAFTNIDGSDENNQDENFTNSLKLKNFGEEEIYPNIKDIKMDDDFGSCSRKKKKEKKKRKRIPEEESTKGSRKIVNLPASRPYIKIIDGEERLCFKYNTKVSESAMNAMSKGDLEDNEFSVRFDLESVDITKLNEKFKAENCVYPRANILHERYVGNRWNYETECNRLAWQFVSLNPVLLYGKKGLIQRAVDSYRNINKNSKGQKFFKDESFYGDIEKRKHISPALASVYIQWSSRGITKKCKIQTGLETLDYDSIPNDFKSKYSVLDDYFDENSFGLEKWETKNEDNLLAVKIAYLNVENTTFINAIKILGISTVMKKAVEAYKLKKTEMINSDDDTDAYDVVSNTFSKTIKEDSCIYY